MQSIDCPQCVTKYEPLSKTEAEDCIRAIDIVINPVSSEKFIPKGWNILLEKLRLIRDGYHATPESGRGEAPAQGAVAWMLDPLYDNPQRLDAFITNGGKIGALDSGFGVASNYTIPLYTHPLNDGAVREALERIAEGRTDNPARVAERALASLVPNNGGKG